MPIRVTILSGFLGAGKTTLLNRLLREPALKNTAVVVNEFGEAGIDPLLVETTASDGVVELANGCVCCSVRGELVETLLTLAKPAVDRRRAPIDRVVIETTGLADPSPIIASLMSHATLCEAYALDGVITVVDVLWGAANLRERTEAKRQVSIADRIVLTKADLATTGALADLREAIDAQHPGVPIVETVPDADLTALLLNCGVVDGTTGLAKPERWLGGTSPTGDHVVQDRSTVRGLSPTDTNGGSEPHTAYSPPHDRDHHHHHHHHHHDHGGIRSFSIVETTPLAWDAVAGFLELLSSTQGDAILRMKAIVQLREDLERPVVLHGVRGHLHPPARLAGWPPGTPRHTRLVIIGEGLSETYVRDLFAAFTGGLRTDAPDRAALEDNPLAVPGFSFS